MRKNLKTYQQVNVESNVIASDPHRIISLLYKGIFDNLSYVKSAIDRKDLEQKSTYMTKAINIIRALQDGLDFDSAPEISNNFNNVYQYCISILSEVSVTLNTKQIDEVVELLKPISDAWNQISEEDKQTGFSLLKAKESA